MTAISWSTACDPIDYLRLMMMSREGDRREGILLRQSKGWFHVGGSGHEALGALAHTLVPEDYVFPYYRDRSIALARGITNYELALAYFAKRASSSGGRQMPGHYSDRKLNIFSVCTPTGASLLPACGAAWAMKLEGKSSLCLASVGDAASRQGEFFEALAFAIQERLPVVFLVEDNKFGISTPTEKFLPMRLGLVPEERVLSFDARDPETVYLAGLQAAELARSGGGPTVLWADLDRLSSHTSSDDHRVYRDLADIEAMMLRDPVELYSNKLIEANLLDSKTFEQMLSDVRKRVDEDYLCAEREADPQPCHVLCHSFAGQEASVQTIQDGPPLTLDQRRPW